MAASAWMQAMAACALEEAEADNAEEVSPASADLPPSPSQQVEGPQPEPTLKTFTLPTRDAGEHKPWTPTLREILQTARPDWTSAELAAARSKLAKVGANCLTDLAEIVSVGGDVLNRKLQGAGLKAFSNDTILVLRKLCQNPEVLAAVERARAKNGRGQGAASLAGLWRPRRPGLGEVIAVRTAEKGDERMSVLPTLRLQPHRAEANPTVVVDPSVRYQTFLGFGGSFTESSAELLLQLGRQRQEQVVEAYFRADVGLGYRMGRTHINSCDFSRGHWACCPEAGDEKLHSFTIARYRRAIIPFIHRANTAAGELLKIVASPWSPPAWMKDTGSMVAGGVLKSEYREVWARHYVKFARELDSCGLPVWAMSVQNEPNAPVSWESCLFTAEEERDFVRDYLGPALESSGMDIKLLVWDHNRDDMLARARVIYADAVAAKYVWGVAFHWYGDPRYERWPDKSGQVRFENVLRTHELRPDKHLVMTEACQEGGPHKGNWSLAERYALNIIRDLSNWTEAWIDWNLILDEVGGPNHKRNFCSAPLLVDTKRDAVHVQPCYYYIGHFSRYIHPGAERILCASNRDCLESIAFANTDGTIAVVVLNASAKAVDFWLEMDGKAAPCLAPERSITTFTLLSDSV